MPMPSAMINGIMTACAVSPIARPLLLVAKRAATMPLSASTDPTDRSTPAVMITKVMPMARMPLIETWRRTISIFSLLRK